jgi:D-alanyl-lipoteichoic acid acyltransferase DltB (MBOAT superfamily)
MALNSFLFLLGFLPIVVAGAHLLRDHRSPRAAQSWILVASLVFYGWDGSAHLVLLLGSIVFNWAIARSLASPRFGPTARRRLLLLGLSADILLLCVFKYANVVSVGLGSLVGQDLAPPNLGFPLGISFFTLTQIMYLVDCYEHLVPPNSLFDHATFVSFFPNITAGPIVRAKLFAGQLGALAAPNDRDDRLTQGVALLSIGLFKKVVLGDSFAHIANAGYADVAALSTLGAWLTMLAGTFEVYFDFSGYSDMAFGAASLLGVSLVRNFNAPFRAVTISDFWQRWHISLSRFITTYLYTPLLRLMGRATIHKSAVATLLAMAVAGLWHGAAWTFLLFYAMHGVGLAGYQYWKRTKRPLPRPLAALTTFAFVNLAFVVVRASDVRTAARLAWHLLPRADLFDITVLRAASASPNVVMTALAVIFGSAVAFVGPTSDEMATRFRPSQRTTFAVMGMLLVAYLFMNPSGNSQFRYRQF